MVRSNFSDIEAAKGTGSLFDGFMQVEAISDPQLLPTDFRDFLFQVGFGVLRDETLCIYNGVVAPKEIFGSAWRGPSLSLFGDDMAGTSYAFDRASHEVVELRADGGVNGVVATTFTAFIRNRIAK